MCRPHSTLYTKGEIQNLFQTWQCDEPIPRKGKKVVVAWAAKGDLDVDMAEVEPTDLPATYGGKLFRVTFSSRAGRAFDQVVQEAHVSAFRVHLADTCRQENLARNAAVDRLTSEAGDDAFKAITSVKSALGCDSTEAVRRVMGRS